jgi:alkanesulfonate monooxygenase SsuD/methylene tetrahydromethanopterin reductase-like flavin-dependent oxidoreductase (luciferase family)
LADYGRELEFGASVAPLADPPDFAKRVSVAADRAGLDLVGIQDHPYQRRFLDTWTLISTLVPVTERIRFFPDVACLPLRPPAVLAKAAASLDVLSGGRVEMGLGAGAFWDAIEVMRLVWSEERSVRFDGEIYTLKGLKPGPHPVHEIGIWVGARGPRMLDLIGRLADGWVPSMGWATPDRLPEMHGRIDEGAARAGRDPGEIRRVYNISGMIGGEVEGSLSGPSSRWIEQLAQFALEFGMDTFIYWPAEDHVRQVELFASEVAPAVRETVAAERRD